MESLYKSLVIVLVISILLTLTLNLYMRHRVMQDEGFSVIYFEEHKFLPEKLKVDESFVSEVTVANHELEMTDYVLEVDSEIFDYQKNISLQPGEYARFAFNVTVDEKVYSVEFGSKKVSSTVIDKGKLYEEYGYVVRDFAGGKRPISINVDRFGLIYHITELDEPLHTIHEKKVEKNNMYEYTFQEKHISPVGDKIYFDGIIDELSRLSIREPFVVKFYKQDSKQDDELEVHFWYEVV